jgi:hypothetical protein
MPGALPPEAWLTFASEITAQQAPGTIGDHTVDLSNSCSQADVINVQLTYGPRSITM